MNWKVHEDAIRASLQGCLQSRAEEDAILDGSWVPPDPGHSDRWSADVDLRIPSVPLGHGKTEDGRTSFHLGSSSVTKSVLPTVNGIPCEFGRVTGRHQDATGFEDYLGRPGAASLVKAADHDRYVSRDSASVLFVEDEDWREADNGIGTSEAGKPIVFSNIAETREKREPFWKAVDEHERTPRIHHLIWDPKASPRFWASLDPDSFSAPKLRDYLAAIRDAIDAARRARARFRPPPLKVTAEEAGRFLVEIVRSPGFNPRRPPVKFKSGCGGRTQYRLEFQLPEEISRIGHWQIAYSIAQFLAKLRLMYTVVVHKPDLHSDDRNYHLHVIYYDRPARFLPEFGQWDFAVQVAHPSRKGRFSYPYRQNKVAEVAQSSGRSGVKGSGRDFPKRLREEFARITNAVLERCGARRRYDPDTYYEMGIDMTPLKHLGPARAALERCGVPTAMGARDAILRWQDRERAIETEREDALWENLRRKSAFEQRLAVEAHSPPRVNSESLKRLIARYGATANEFVESHAAWKRVHLLYDKARSRSEIIKRTGAKVGKKSNREAARSEKRVELARAWSEAVHRPFYSAGSQLYRLIDLERRLCDERADLSREIEACLLDRDRQPQIVGGDVSPETIEAAKPPPIVATTTQSASAPATTSAAPTSKAAQPGLKKHSIRPPVAGTPTPKAPVVSKAPSSASSSPAPAGESGDAAAKAKRRAELDEILTAAAVKRRRVSVIGSDYCIEPDEAGDALIVRSPLSDSSLKAHAQNRLAQLFQDQEREVSALKAALAASDTVAVVDGAVSTDSVPSDLQHALSARARWPEFVSVAQARLESLQAAADVLRKKQIDEAAAARQTETEALLTAIDMKSYSGTFRVAREGEDRYAVPLEPFSLAECRILTDRTMEAEVQATLATMFEQQAAIIKIVCGAIRDAPIAPADADGKLNPSSLPDLARAFAKAWGGEPEIAAALRAKLEAEREHRAASLAEAPIAVLLRAVQDEPITNGPATGDMGVVNAPAQIGPSLQEIEERVAPSEPVGLGAPADAAPPGQQVGDVEAECDFGRDGRVEVAAADHGATPPIAAEHSAPDSRQHIKDTSRPLHGDAPHLTPESLATADKRSEGAMDPPTMETWQGLMRTIDECCFAVRYDRTSRRYRVDGLEPSETAILDHPDYYEATQDELARIVRDMEAISHGTAGPIDELPEALKERDAHQDLIRLAKRTASNEGQGH